MRKIRAIIAASAIVLAGVGIAGIPVEAATPYSCAINGIGWNGSSWTGARGRCQQSTRPSLAYRINILCEGTGWQYGPTTTYPNYSSKSCPFAGRFLDSYMTVFV